MNVFQLLTKPEQNTQTSHDLPQLLSGTQGAEPAQVPRVTLPWKADLMCLSCLGGDRSQSHLSPCGDEPRAGGRAEAPLEPLACSRAGPGGGGSRLRCPGRGVGVSVSRPGELGRGGSAAAAAARALGTAGPRSGALRVAPLGHCPSPAELLPPPAGSGCRSPRTGASSLP